MPLNFNIFDQDPIKNEVQYKARRLEVMIQVEEGGTLKQQPYVDPKGLATMGLGMNLQVQVVRETVLDKIFGTFDNEDEALSEAEEAYKIE